MSLTRSRLAVFLPVLAICTALTVWGYRAAQNAPYGAADQFYGVWRSDAIDRAPVGVDDANIFFVYGRNLAAGEGLVWSEGGERVEGYSSTLWLAIVTPLFKLGLPVEKALTILGVLLTAAVLTLLGLEVGRQLRSAGAATAWLGGAAVIVWSLAVPGYLVWCCLTLMETGLWSAVLIVATAVVLAEIRGEGQRPRHRRAMGFLVVALLLTRPEGMLWAGFFAALYAGAIALRDRDWRGALGSFGILVAIYVATLATLTAF
ncbi:MAG TPA: hypothetical protein VLC48_10600, partial [Gemmatimonadota bacterium]|nr:hypothetical protein [Gemmatimonadota bacterium]